MTGDVPLRKRKTYKTLDKDLLTGLVAPNRTVNQKRTLFNKHQSSGFLGILAEIAASAIASLIGARIAATAAKRTGGGAGKNVKGVHRPRR